VSWERTREFINDRYHLEYLIICHEPDRWNFSAEGLINATTTMAAAQNSLSSGGIV
jgi:hypothetical protein